MINKQIIIAVLFGLIIGASISGTIVYQTFQARYFVIHKTNIGGFIFWDGKIFNLSEMKDIKD